MATFQFPDGFLWGAATSAHQVEGGNHNDWFEWEAAHARRLARESRRQFGSWLKAWPQFRHAAENPDNYRSRHACDHYNRFRDDFDIAQKIGHNAHRFSIEWSRIEPQEGRFDSVELEHYRMVIQALRGRGLEPFVTLWHWTIPIWLRDQGGVTSRKFPHYFARYAGYVASNLGHDVHFWMTINEPTSVIINSYIRGIWPPQKRGVLWGLRASRILAQGHRQAYQAIHRVQPSAAVGFGNIVSFIEPASKNRLDALAAYIFRFFSNKFFFRLTGNDTHDYIALQNYFHQRVSFPWRMRNENKKISDLGWELYPQSLYHLLKEWGAYGKPIYITEHGLADADDTQRAWFIREAVRNIARAASEGVDVRGYFHWSLLDNFEWDKGFWPRFGLVAIHYQTQARSIRPSAWEYQKIITAHAIDL